MNREPVYDADRDLCPRCAHNWTHWHPADENGLRRCTGDGTGSACELCFRLAAQNIGVSPPSIIGIQRMNEVRAAIAPLLARASEAAALALPPSR